MDLDPVHEDEELETEFVRGRSNSHSSKSSSRSSSSNTGSDNRSHHSSVDDNEPLFAVGFAEPPPPAQVIDGFRRISQAVMMGGALARCLADSGGQMLPGIVAKRKKANFIEDVKKNFVQLRCTKYVPSGKEKKGWKIDDCCCGRSLKHHEDRGLFAAPDGAGPSKWTKASVMHEPATCFGNCEMFLGTSSSRVPTTAKFLRFAADATTAESAFKVMNQHWNVKEPHLIISVIGGARRFILDNKVLMRFNKGLIQAARSAEAWVITNGLHKGVTRIIGESMAESQGDEDEPIVCLGIASWGILDNVDVMDDPGQTTCMIRKGVSGQLTIPSSPDLETSTAEGHWPFVYIAEDKNNNDKFPAPMDLNHTHYLLVDTPQHKNYGDELEWRAKFEDHLFNLGNRPPGVLLILEGGETTLVNAKSYMKKKRPVVVIKGIGGTSDLLAYAYNICSEEGIPSNFDKLMAECPHMDRFTLFDEPHEKEIQTRKAIELSRECMKMRQLITVVDLNNKDESLDTAILHANFKAFVNNSADHNLALLNLALQWNRADVARQYIFTTENMSQPKFFEDLRERGYLAKAAVLKNYPEFVELFLEAGLSVSREMTYSTLFSLYSAVIYASGHSVENEARLLSHVIADEGELPADPPAVRFMLHVGEIIRELIGDTADNIYSYGGADEGIFDQMEDFTGFKKIRPSRINPVQQEEILQ